MFKFRDPRATRARIYRATEGLPWAITDLARRLNTLIGSGDVEGAQIGPGDILQAAVTAYFCDGTVMKPQTTPDSPAYATLPYRIVVAEGGYWTAEPALPPETLIHFRIPETVGDLIPNLTEDQRAEAMISLQLKEATHVSAERLEVEARRAQDAGEYRAIEKQEDSFSLARFAEASTHRPGGGAGDEWRDLTVFLDGVARGEGPQARIKRKLSERSKADTEDFGFGKVK